MNYHRVFIKDYAAIAARLYQLTAKNPFQWEQKHQAAFEEIKELLTTAPVLAMPNANDHSNLDTDASDEANHETNHKNLDSNVANAGLKYRDPRPPGDGNCLFHALADQLQMRAHLDITHQE